MALQWLQPLCSDLLSTSTALAVPARMQSFSIQHMTTCGRRACVSSQD